MTLLDATRAPAHAASRPHAGATWFLAALWLASGVALFAGLGQQAVRRTQEARVLVTAREMLGQPWQRWMIPHTNGSVRLRKPPLAYWLSAASFAVLGTSEAAGRAPAGLAAWLLLGATFAAGRFMFGPRAALLSAAALLCCLGFMRFMLLAETDPLAALFVTVAMYATYRAYDACAEETSRGRAALWFHLAAIGMALALMTKGPPAFYPLLFLVALGALDRRWSPLGKWFTCGAPLTFALLGAPWFIYMFTHPEAWQATHDLRNSALGGEGHGGWFFEYFPQLFTLLLPWSGLAVLALVAAVQRWHVEPRLRVVLVWVASILVPLCLWGNKQPHYLLPLLPPVMLLVGWLVDRAMTSASEPADFALWVRRVWLATLALAGLAAPTLIVWARAERGSIRAGDVALCVALLGLVGGAFAVTRASSAYRGALVLALGLGLLGIPILAPWQASLARFDGRWLARTIRDDFGAGPYVFYGGGENLVLCFYLGGVVPHVTETHELHEMLARTPRPVVLQALAENHTPDAPPGHVEVKTYRTKGRKVMVFAAEAPS